MAEQSILLPASDSSTPHMRLSFAGPSDLPGTRSLGIFLPGRRLQLFSRNPPHRGAAWAAWAHRRAAASCPRIAAAVSTAAPAAVAAVEAAAPLPPRAAAASGRCPPRRARTWGAAAAAPPFAPPASCPLIPAPTSGIVVRSANPKAYTLSPLRSFRQCSDLRSCATFSN